jgi:hypothetical protein
MIKKYNTFVRNKASLLIAIGLFMSFLLLSLYSVDASLGVYKAGNCVELKTILNTTAVNISTINYPNSTVAVSNQAMTKIASTFNYTFCNTNDLGIYVYDYFDTVTGNVYVNDFEISATGKDMTSAKATSYVIIFIVAFLVFLGFLAIGIYLPAGNKKDEMTGYVLAISNLKYVKIFSFCFAYLIALFIAYFAWMVCYAYLDMNFITEIFRILFYGELILLLPLFILFTYIIFANAVRDMKIGEMLSRGLSVRGDER